MKKFFCAATTALTLLCACSKENDTTAMPSNEGLVILTLEDGTTSRAFFDNTAAAETWEKSLSSLSVFVFDASDALLIRRDFTASELASKSASFALPKSAANTSCVFYAVANLSVADVTTKAALLLLLERDAAAYNGTFAETSTQALRSAGFVMSGAATQTVGAVNSVTRVGITLKRTVAKVALQTSIDASFADKYPGTLSIHSVKVSKAASQSLVVEGAPSSGSMSYTHTQNATPLASKFNNLFYLYETETLAAGNRVRLEINATYSYAGSESEVIYAVELTGSSAGQILRNGYYRISANITGLVGQDCAVSVTVSDWESPTTQSVDLGI